MCLWKLWISVVCILTVQVLIFSGNFCVILDFSHQRWPILCLLPCPSHSPHLWAPPLSPPLLVVALWTLVMERLGVKLCHSPILLNDRTGFSYFSLCTVTLLKFSTQKYKCADCFISWLWQNQHAVLEWLFTVFSFYTNCYINAKTQECNCLVSGCFSRVKIWLFSEEKYRYMLCLITMLFQNHHFLFGVFFQNTSFQLDCHLCVKQ